MVVYKAFIRSRLEYCSSLLFCANCASITASLEKCQRRAIRVIYGVPQNSVSDEFSVTEARLEAGLQTLEARRVVQFNLLVGKIVAGKASTYLLSLLEACGRSRKPLRNRCPYILPLARARFGKSRFTYAAIVALKSDVT